MMNKYLDSVSQKIVEMTIHHLLDQHGITLIVDHFKDDDTKREYHFMKVDNRLFFWRTFNANPITSTLEAYQNFMHHCLVAKFPDEYGFEDERK